MEQLNWASGIGPQVCLLMFTAPCRAVSDLSPMREVKLAVSLLLNLWNDEVKVFSSLLLDLDNQNLLSVMAMGLAGFS